MKYLLILSAVLAFGCKKTNELPSTASLTLINAVVGSNPLVTNFSNNYAITGGTYSSALQIIYGSFNAAYQLSGYTGSQALRVYQYPDTTEKSNPLFQLSLDIPVGSIRTLFLCGTVAKPDTLYTSDQPPYHPASDSVIGIRFINLSTGSNPVNVTLSTSTTVNEFAGITYKGMTAFKSYPATAAVSSYTFQFRDAATNAILATYTMSGVNNGTGSNTSTNTVRFKNFTLALIGNPVGTGAAFQKTLLVNNY